MGWKSIRGQDAALDLLRRDLSSGQVASAYLFYGPDGVGKASAARLFAQALQCPGEAPPCGGCIACEKVGANAHPDVVSIRPAAGSRSIKVELIREEVIRRPPPASQRGDAAGFHHRGFASADAGEPERPAQNAGRAERRHDSDSGDSEPPCAAADGDLAFAGGSGFRVWRARICSPSSKSDAGTPTQTWRNSSLSAWGGWASPCLPTPRPSPSAGMRRCGSSRS